MVFLLAQKAAPHPFVNVLETLLKQPSERGTIVGRVVFRESGKPVVGARIVPATGTYQGIACTQAKTDRNGSYSVNVMPGSWQISVILPPSLSASYTSFSTPWTRIEKQEQKTVTVDVFHGNVVRGKVSLPDGKPAAGGHVGVMFDSIGSGDLSRGAYGTTVARDGKYVLNLPPGRYLINAQCRFGGLYYEKNEAKLDAGASKVFDLKLDEDMEMTKIVRANQRRNKH